MDKISFDYMYKSVIRFNKARGWDPVPGDSAKSIVIEGSELLEHFQWDASDLGADFPKDKNWEEIGLEVADILWYLITFCEKAGVDLLLSLQKKLEKNEVKYPVEKFNGRHNEQFYREQKRKYRQDKKQ
jgi:NTP pyrophosphatase (non-canonical NTP hydrolase)